MAGDSLEAAFWARSKKRAGGETAKRSDAILDCTRFVRWVSSSNLDVSNADAELVFGKCTPGGERHLEYKHFLRRAVPALAHRAGHTVPEVVDMMTDAIPPVTPRIANKSERPQLVDMNGSLSKSGRQVLPQVPQAYSEALRASFLAFASYGCGGRTLEHMDSTKFSKMCQDCSILCRSFTRNEVDLIFRKAKAPNERKITFEQFITKAVPLTALGRGAQIKTVCKYLANGRPVARGAKASVSSGIFAKVTDSSIFTGASNTRGDGHHPQVQAVEPEPLPAVPEKHRGAIQAVFAEFCAFGCHSRPPATAMDIVKFAKLARDSGLVAKQSDGRVDMAFTESCARGARRISGETFLDVTLPLVAAKLRMDVAEVAQKVAGAEPSTTGTVVETSGVFEKLTDQRRYTGMYAALAGVDQDEVRRLETLYHRTVLAEVPADLERNLREPIKEAMRQFGPSDHQGKELVVEEDQFFRMVRDARLLGPGLTETDVATVFRLVKEKFFPALDYEGLVQRAVPLMAAARSESDVYRVASRLSQALPQSAAAQVRRAGKKFTNGARLFGTLTFRQADSGAPSSPSETSTSGSAGPLPSLRSTPDSLDRGPYRPRVQQFGLNLSPSRPGTSSSSRPSDLLSVSLPGRPCTSQSGTPSSFRSSGLWGSDLLGEGGMYSSLPGYRRPELNSLSGARTVYTPIVGRRRRKSPPPSIRRPFLDNRPEWDDHVLR